MSTSVTIDRDYYNQEKVTKENFKTWIEKNIEIYTKYTEIKILKDPIGDSCKVLELGAGSCWASLMISKINSVEKIVCIDISANRMKERSLLANEIIFGDLSKITFIEADFNQQIPLPDGDFDLILFDAALHHSRSIWETLFQCHRLLKKNGRIIAQREGFLYPLAFNRQFRWLLTTPEGKCKVSENLYLRQQYEYYFKQSGFDVTFTPVILNMRDRILFNIGIFNKYIILATKNQ